MRAPLGHEEFVGIRCILLLALSGCLPGRSTIECFGDQDCPRGEACGEDRLCSPMPDAGADAGALDTGRPDAVADAARDAAPEDMRGSDAPVGDAQPDAPLPDMAPDAAPACPEEGTVEVACGRCVRIEPLCETTSEPAVTPLAPGEPLCGRETDLFCEPADVVGWYEGWQPAGWLFGETELWATPILPTVTDDLSISFRVLNPAVATGVGLGGPALDAFVFAPSYLLSAERQRLVLSREDVTLVEAPVGPLALGSRVEARRAKGIWSLHVDGARVAEAEVPEEGRLTAFASATNRIANPLHLAELVIRGDPDNDGLLEPDDPCPRSATLDCLDSDCDGVPDEEDACPFASDPSQADADCDGTGDACEPGAFRVVVVRDGGPLPGIWVLDPARGLQQRLREGTGYTGASLSPSGSWLAYERDGDAWWGPARPGIRDQRAEGGRTPQWTTADGGTVLLHLDDFGLLRGSSEFGETLDETPDGVRRRVWASRSGERLLVLEETADGTTLSLPGAGMEPPSEIPWPHDFDDLLVPHDSERMWLRVDADGRLFRHDDNGMTALVPELHVSRAVFGEGDELLLLTASEEGAALQALAGEALRPVLPATRHLGPGTLGLVANVGARWPDADSDGLDDESDPCPGLANGPDRWRITRAPDPSPRGVPELYQVAPGVPLLVFLTDGQRAFATLRRGVREDQIQTLLEEPGGQPALGVMPGSLALWVGDRDEDGSLAMRYRGIPAGGDDPGRGAPVTLSADSPDHLPRLFISDEPRFYATWCEGETLHRFPGEERLVGSCTSRRVQAAQLGATTVAGVRHDGDSISFVGFGPNGSSVATFETNGARNVDVAFAGQTPLLAWTEGVDNQLVVRFGELEDEDVELVRVPVDRNPRDVSLLVAAGRFHALVRDASTTLVRLSGDGRPEAVVDLGLGQQDVTSQLVWDPLHQELVFAFRRGERLSVARGVAGCPLPDADLRDQ